MRLVGWLTFTFPSPNEFARHNWMRSFEPLRSGSQDDISCAPWNEGNTKATLRMMLWEERLTPQKRQRASAHQRVLTFAGRTPKMNPRFAITVKSGAPRHV